MTFDAKTGTFELIYNFNVKFLKSILLQKKRKALILVFQKI